MKAYGLQGPELYAVTVRARHGKVVKAEPRKSFKQKVRARQAAKAQIRKALQDL